MRGIKNCIEALNQEKITAIGITAVRASNNKDAFDDKIRFSRDLNALVVGQAVKLRNEKHTKGRTRWFGPFKIAIFLDNKVYILVHHNGMEYPRLVNSNSIRLVALCLLIVNNMWLPPQAIAQRKKQKEAWVAKGFLQKTQPLARVWKEAPSQLRKLSNLWLGGSRFV